MPNYIDLHTHSTASDGIYSPTELLHRAKDIGLRVLALTDHDSTGGLDEAAQAAAKLDIDLSQASKSIPMSLVVKCMSWDISPNTSDQPSRPY